jgi:hypothetical protein
LMVSFLLNVRGVPLDDLLHGRYDGAAIEQALGALEAYPQKTTRDAWARNRRAIISADEQSPPERGGSRGARS